MVNSLVTFGLSMRLEIALDPPLGPYCKLVFLSQSTEPIFMGHIHLYLAYFIPQRDLCMFCCT